jgi:hypothetical protein
MVLLSLRKNIGALEGGDDDDGSVWRAEIQMLLYSSDEASPIPFVEVLITLSAKNIQIFQSFELCQRIPTFSSHAKQPLSH